MEGVGGHERSSGRGRDAPSGLGSSAGTRGSAPLQLVEPNRNAGGGGGGERGRAEEELPPVHRAVNTNNRMRSA
jgi:hypothetical protein